MIDDPKQLSVGYFSQQSASWDAGSGWTNAGLGRLVEALNERVGEFTAAISQTVGRAPKHDHQLALPEGTLRLYPHVRSMSLAMRMGGILGTVLRELEAKHDVVIVQMPFAPPTTLLRQRGPRVYHVCADLVGVVSGSEFYRGLRRVAALTAAHVIDASTFVFARRKATRLVTNGRQLYDHYGRPPGRFTVSSTLRLSEVGTRKRQRPTDAPFRILFVGFLRPEKGIDILVETYRRMLARTPGIELEIVGTQDLVAAGAARQLADALPSLQERGRVTLRGYLPLGPELFQAYADADVLVLPSRSEGTPRVLLEARAFGCPVVASRVGGIVTSVQDGVDGLLVAPNDVDSLLAAVERIRTDPALRARLVTAGLQTARRTTVDAYADDVVAEAMAAYRSNAA